MPFWLIFLIFVSVTWAVIYGDFIASLGRRRLPVRHQPDYAKIARLEVELGLVEPPPPVDPEPVVKVSMPTRFDPNGFGYKTYGVRDTGPEK